MTRFTIKPCSVKAHRIPERVFCEQKSAPGVISGDYAIWSRGVLGKSGYASKEKNVLTRKYIRIFVLSTVR